MLIVNYVSTLVPMSRAVEEETEKLLDTNHLDIVGFQRALNVDLFTSEID